MQRKCLVSNPWFPLRNSEEASLRRDDGIWGGSNRKHCEKSSSFCRNSLLFLNHSHGFIQALRGAQYWEGKKESVLGRQTGEKANTPKPKESQRSNEGRGMEGICANTDFTCNSFKGSGIFITKKSLIKVSRDLP